MCNYRKRKAPTKQPINPEAKQNMIRGKGIKEMYQKVETNDILDDTSDTTLLTQTLITVPNVKKL